MPEPNRGEASASSPGVTAENRQQVEVFYRAAIEAGGQDNLVRLVYARNTTRVTMLLLSSVRTGTTSKRFATNPGPEAIRTLTSLDYFGIPSTSRWTAASIIVQVPRTKKCIVSGPRNSPRPILTALLAGRRAGGSRVFEYMATMIKQYEEGYRVALQCGDLPARRQAAAGR